MEDLLQKINADQLEEHALAAVVKGIMPVETEELITAMHLICAKNEAFLEDAKNTFNDLPDGFKKDFFANREIDAALLGFFFTRFPLPLEAKESCILNPRLRGSDLVLVAPSLEAELLDLAVNNQVKILEAPGIVDALEENPELTIIHHQKLAEYRRLFFKNQISSAEELEAKSVTDIEREAIEDAKEFVQAFGKEQITLRELREKDSPERESVLQQIQRMSVPQRVQAAIKGDREVRGILVRDPNKLVCSAVIKSPKITDAEVEFYSNLRNVQTEVLRLIAQNREWLKSYRVIHNLVKNPRTPLPFTIKMLHRLQTRDLKFLVRDRGVPEALRAMARRMTRVDQGRR